jgi:toxin ParE1/3/4
MAYTVVWSFRAIDDVEAIATYIAEDSESYAASVVRDILLKTRKLSEFPHLGRVGFGVW